MEQEKSFDEWFDESNYVVAITRENLPLNGIVNLRSTMRKCHEWTKQNERNRIISEIKSLGMIKFIDQNDLKLRLIKIIKGE